MSYEKPSKAEVNMILDAWYAMQEENKQLRGTLSLAEEGLANYAQEVEAMKHDIERLTAVASAEATENERLQRENGVVREEIDRLLDGLARIKEHSDGTSIAWTLAYEALHNRPYSYPGCSGASTETPK